MMIKHDHSNYSKTGVDVHYHPSFPVQNVHVLLYYETSMIQAWRPECMIVQMYAVVEKLSLYSFAQSFVTLVVVTMSEGEVVVVD